MSLFFTEKEKVKFIIIWGMVSGREKLAFLQVGKGLNYHYRFLQEVKGLELILFSVEKYSSTYIHKRIFNGREKVKKGKG